MFLNQLTVDEQKAFVNLSIHAAKANGEFADEEKAMIEQYCKEMDILFFGGDDILSMETIISLYSQSDISTKRIVVLEVLGLMYADGSYDSSENEFVKKFASAIGLSDDELDKQEELLKRYLEVTQDMVTAIHL